MVKKLKKELIAAVVSVMIAAVALSSSTYAWYISNNTVQGTTSQIVATTNGFILQIALLSDGGAQHGGNNQSLQASTSGGKITPSSTNDLKNWYICEGWDTYGKVVSYMVPPNFTGGKNGEYNLGDGPHYAYIRSEYVLYTMTATGLADVYLDATQGTPITVEVDNGITPGSATIPNSLRIGITTQPLASDGVTPIESEVLRVVYAPAQETGIGNDTEGKVGMTAIDYDGGILKPVTVKYPYIYNGHYLDVNNQNWVVSMDSEKQFVFPEGYSEANSQAIAKGVGYNGVLLRVYIWLEGTDADCVNNAVAEDEATYSVTVKLAGIATTAP